jgi:hypothetical protein
MDWGVVGAVAVGVVIVGIVVFAVYWKKRGGYNRPI